MTDWEKLKVADLKEELKSRGVPLTGLKLKQQLIDKLNELDSWSNNGEKDTVKEPDEGKVDAVEDESQDDEPTSKPSPPSRKPQELQNEAIPLDILDEENQDAAHTPDRNTERLENNQVEGDHEPKRATRDPTGDDRIDKLPSDLPMELKKEESYARDGSTPPPVKAENVSEEKAISKDNPFLPEEGLRSQSVDETPADDKAKTATSEEDVEDSDQSMQDPEGSTDQNGDTKSTTEPAASITVSTQELLDDQRKRKRRSVSPAPQAEVSKKTKLNDGASTPSKRESDALQKVQEATDAAQAIRSLDDVHNHIHVSPADQNEDRTHSTEEEHRDSGVRAPDIQAQEEQMQETSRSPSRMSEERDVAPAIHPATQSIYIRNFKRPLHIPTLRNNISALVRSSEDNPLKIFYLNSIRTHAFVAFNTISAASRVRNAMHGTRFPDEPMREPLWIDFIPDEKVQAWIDQETGGSGSGGFGGGRGLAKKFEVVYNDAAGGVIDAIHQEVLSGGTQPQRLSFSQSTSNRVVPQDSTAVAAAAPSGVHPSRASLVPFSPAEPRSQRPQVQTKRSEAASGQGKGFRALDELFSSTTAKPKLYYKLPPQPTIDDRNEMMRDLRVGHDQMGKSGDEGMKRYSFEKDERSGREEWVDKGPEFGYGKRGQERLTGYGNTYGGGRGRGGFRGSRRGGDSWRGR